MIKKNSHSELGLVISSLSRSNKWEDQLKSLEAISRDNFFPQNNTQKSECVKNHSVRIPKKNGIKFPVEKVRGYVSLEEGEMCAPEEKKKNKQGKSTSKRKTKRRLDTPFGKNGSYLLWSEKKHFLSNFRGLK